MSRKERRIKHKKNTNRIINLAIINVILIAVIYLSFYANKEKKNKNQEMYSTEKLSVENSDLSNNILKTEIVIPKEKIQEKYKNYDVSAKLEIPKIGLETYILATFSKEALNVSVTKFWGPSPNTIGNFCIAGHNFKNKNMFSKLKKLEIGDRFFLVDNKVGKLEYEVYEIYVVEPKDVGCLSQETNGKREITLITCTSDSKKRIIVKAREI